MTNEFTHEELTWIQECANHLRAIAFNQLMEAKHRDHPTEELEREYQLSRSVRDKLYHLNGRDTLAPGVHEQRWDQPHDR